MIRSRFTGTIASLTAILLLSACASMPIPIDVDLRGKVGDTEEKGTITEPIEAGESKKVDLRLPETGDKCIDFADIAPDAITVRSAKLQWIIDVSYSGPELSGDLEARLYLTGRGDDIFDKSNKLGPVFQLDLDKATNRLEGTAELDAEHLEAVNDRKICWGIAITGENVSAAEDGTLEIDYKVKKAMLHITFSVF